MTADDVALAARVVVAIILVASGVGKLLAVRQSIRQYRMQFGRYAWITVLVALALPLYELVLAALLLFVDATWPSWLALVTFAVFTVVLPAAAPGIITGIVLALARIAGETAPLLFTSFNNRFWSTSLTQPMASLTVQIYTYALAPYDDWHRQAWAGALVLVVIVLVCSILARLATRRVEQLRG